MSSSCTVSPSSLLPLLDRLAGRRVMCLGDVMLDRYVYGEVERISPEAPVPILHVRRESVVPGGSGNVARNIAALGGHAYLVGIAGNDATGMDLAQQLEGSPSITASLIADGSRPTTLKMRFVATGQQLLRADYEVSSPINAETEDAVIANVRRLLAKTDIVVLSDYAKGMLAGKLAGDVIALARQKGIMVIVDPKGRDFSRYRGAHLVTPNRKELADVTGSMIRDIADTERAARMLIATYDLGGMLVKLGSEGVCLIMRDLPAQHFPAIAREVYDVSGAGDTVSATMAMALASGVDTPQAAALANTAGAVVVGKVGTAVVTCDDLARELRRDDARQSDEKLLTAVAASEAAERWTQQGLKVGFTNGVFDLLHPGHISLIRQARAACDRLIVGINSDASTRRLKGDSRPVQSEIARAAVLSSLKDVDSVVIFEEDTPLELICLLRPAVLVKGADYRADQVVGADVVQSNGGTVVLADLVAGQSTTSTIAKMNRG